VAFLSAVVDAVVGLLFARSKGYREQAGRQDREARGQVAAALRPFRKRLEQEETRRAAMRRGDTVAIAGEDLRVYDCAEHVWHIMDAVDNPLLSRRAALQVERHLRKLMGAPFIEHLKRRRSAPGRPGSLSGMHAILRELVQAGVIDLSGKAAQTPIDRMFTGENNDPEPVARVRRRVEKIIATLLR